MIKKCVVCGTEFEPLIHIGRRQKCCSKPCSRIYNRAYNNAVKASDAEREKAREKYRIKNLNRTLCKFCGKPMPIDEWSGHKKHYHDECALKDAADAILNGKKINKTQYNRLYVRGYDMAEIKAVITGGGIIV